MTLTNRPSEKIIGKGENAGYQQFLLFPKCFLPFPKKNFNFSVKFILSSASAFKLDRSKNWSFGKELNLSQTKPWILWGFFGTIKSLEKTFGKGETACKEQLLHFLQCFLPVWRMFLHFKQIENCSLPILWRLWSLEESEICFLGKG